MAVITFTIPDGQIQRVIDALNGLNPIPPEEEGSFTAAQWTKEVVRRWIIAKVLKYERQEALAAAGIEFDDDLVA